jgi:hypothetical protein
MFLLKIEDLNASNMELKQERSDYMGDMTKPTTKSKPTKKSCEVR